jgi:hypothetical protein
MHGADLFEEAPATNAGHCPLDRGVSRLVNEAKNICPPPLALPETMDVE